MKSILRRTVSLTSLLSFILMSYTGVVLLFTPQGRVSYWANWKFWGMNKEDLGNTHITTSILFMIAIFLHVYLNWKPIVNYMKSKSGNLIVVTKEMAISAVLTVFIFWGTLGGLTPIKKFLYIFEEIKEEIADEIGNPPFNHAELSSLEGFTWKMKLDLEKSLVLLKENGIKVPDSTLSLKDIAKSNGVGPSEIYEIIKNAKAEKKVSDEKNVDESGSMSEEKNEPASEDAAPTGLGRKPLAKVAELLGISTDDAVRILKENGIQASEDDQFKSIAEDAKMMPVDLYNLLKNSKK